MHLLIQVILLAPELVNALVKPIGKDILLLRSETLREGFTLREHLLRPRLKLLEGTVDTRIIQYGLVVELAAKGLRLLVPPAKHRVGPSRVRLEPHMNGGILAVPLPIRTFQPCGIGKEIRVKTNIIDATGGTFDLLPEPLRVRRHADDDSTTPMLSRHETPMKAKRKAPHR